MAGKVGELRAVEVIRAFHPGGPASVEVAPGARLWGAQVDGHWRLLFNGADVDVPDGTVGEPDSVEVKQAAEERRSAREEEYQSAPTPSKG